MTPLRPHSTSAHAAVTGESGTLFSSMQPQGDPSMRTLLRPLFFLLPLVALLLMLVPAASYGQTETGTITGVVVDADGARIPGARLALNSTRTKTTRTATSNATGVLEFNAVPTGTYTLTAQMPGFETLITSNIQVHPNDTITLPPLKMKAGAEDVSVTVEANTDISTSGERSSLITAGDIQKLSTVGRDVSELLRTQAGFSQLQSGLDNSAASSAEVAGTYSGLSNYVGNGATGNGASLISDGANVTDPISGNGQTQTVNMDFVSEVKIETSNFGADTAHGPTVITAVGKSGGQQFHGDIRAAGRTYQLNGQDWFQKFIGFRQIQDRYIYPGVEIGGPIIIPHTKFNSARRFTFEAGAEDYAQRNVYSYGSLPKSLLAGLVPTKSMINGDFSETRADNSLGNYLGVTYDDIVGTPGVGRYGLGCTAAGQLSQYLHICAQPGAGPLSATNHFANGQLQGGVNGIDPGVRAILRAYYEPGCTNTDLSSCAGPGPTFNAGESYNTQTLNLQNPDSYQMRGRVDYKINDANRVYFVYNGQFGFTSGIPEQIYYSPGTSGAAILGGVDTPGKVNATTHSNTASVNYTRIFSPRTTNEFFVAAAQNFQSFASGNQQLLSKSYWGYPYGGLYPNGTFQLPEVATYSTTGAAILPFALTPDFSAGPFVAKRFLPSGGDNYTHTIKNHTLKVGVFLERDTGNETDLSPNTSGQISDYYLPAITGSATGFGENYLADFFEGYIGSFSQQNRSGQTNLYFWTISWFANDSWKATRRLTLDYGVRFDHLGPWQDKHGLGMAVFYPSLYKTDPLPYQNADGSAFLPGVRWHGGNKAVNGNAANASTPNAGTPARFAFVSPRVGIAFDAFGDGRTIFRGGWGMYRAHDSVNDYTGPQQTSQGIVNVSAGGTGGAFLLSSLNNTAALACNANTQTLCPSILALSSTDDQQPLTMTYSFSVSQRMPGGSVFDIGYVGNQSRDLLTDNGSQNVVQSQDLRDINPIPLGAFFKPDPNPQSPFYGQSYSPNAPPNNATQQQTIQNDYRPYTEYAHIGIPRHITYANYNALQVTFNRQKGKLNYGLNYTWSKALGIRGAYNNGIAGDPTNLRANYGPLAFDRTNLVAASYSYDEGKVFGFSNRLLRGASNYWLISGITNLQSGPNLQAVYSPNLSLAGFATSSYNGNQCTANSAAGQTLACTISNSTILGTPDISLQPVLRPAAGCPSGNPTSGLAKHQYVNGTCFGLPADGLNGPTNMGYLRGPAFFNSDLTLQKTIPLKESRNLQFRVAAFNFINHPLVSFSSRFPREANLQFYDPNYTGFSGVQLANGAVAGANCSAAGSQCFGYAGYKTGRRVLELSGRFNF